MSVVQDWVNGDFQDYDTVCGLLNYTDSRIFYYVKTIQELYVRSVIKKCPVCGSLSIMRLEENLHRVEGYDVLAEEMLSLCNGTLLALNLLDMEDVCYVTFAYSEKYDKLPLKIQTYSSLGVKLRNMFEEVTNEENS